jgi:hypothetical protein
MVQRAANGDQNAIKALKERHD